MSESDDEQRAGGVKKEPEVEEGKEETGGFSYRAEAGYGFVGEGKEEELDWQKGSGERTKKAYVLEGR